MMAWLAGPGGHHHHERWIGWWRAMKGERWAFVMKGFLAWFFASLTIYFPETVAAENTHLVCWGLGP